MSLSGGISVPPSPARLDGVWWGVSAQTTQAVASALGCQLLTPLLADLIRDQATIRLDFHADRSSGTGAMMGAPSMLRFSADLVRRVAAAGGDLRGDVIPLSCLGTKDWALTAGLQRGVNPYSGKALPSRWACNYGAYHPSGSPSVSGRWDVIQTPGYAHDQSHLDYSQLLRVCRVPPSVTAPSHDGCTARVLPGYPAPLLASDDVAGGLLLALGIGLL